MRTTFQVGADSRHDQGKGASRRLRRAGKVPAILYGGHGEPENVVLDHQQLLTLIDNEKFYSSIISLNLDSQAQPAIVRDVQMHPARNAVVHVDLQRVVENAPLKIRLPIHFKGAASAPGVKTQGGIVHHLIAQVEVSCLPDELPEFLELDLSNMELNDTLFLSDLPLPKGVTVPQLKHANPPVVSVHSPRVIEIEEAATAAPAEGAAAAAPAAGATAAPGGAAPATAVGAKNEEPKKEEGKREQGGAEEGEEVTARAPLRGRARATAQAHRRSGQSRRRVRTHASQCGLVATGCARPTAARGVAYGSQATSRGEPDPGAARRALADQANLVHEPQRRTGGRVRCLLPHLTGGDPGRAR